MSRSAAIDRPEHPDRLIFDLDPPGHGGENGDFALVVAAARAVRDALEAVDLTSFVMTSGSSGLHVTVPLDRRAGFDTVREFAQGVAERVADAPSRRIHHRTCARTSGTGGCISIRAATP